MPEVKFSIVGTRPNACRPKKVTTPPELDGSITPTRSPGFVNPAILRPSAKLARIRSM